MMFLKTTKIKNCSKILVNTLTKTIDKNVSISRRYFQNLSALTQFSNDEFVMQQTVNKITREYIKPYVNEMDKEHKYRQSVIDTLFKNGIIGLTVDSKYGGSGCNFMTNILAIEEIAKVDPAVAVLVNVQNSLVIKLLNKFGNEKLKSKYLPKMVEDTIGSFCLSEPENGSDAFGLKTTATKVVTNYFLNGQKMWSSNADIAGVFLVMANVNPSLGYKGITCFIVDRDVEGVEIAEPKIKMGICASGTCSVKFANVKVPETNIVGEVGHGYKYIAASLNESRIGVGAQMVGLAQGAFNATIPYTLERKQFNQPIFNFQSMQHQIAQIATQIESARLLTYNAARLVDAKQPVLKQAAMAKYYAAEVAQQTAVKCIDWMGGVAFTKDLPHEKFYRDCKIGSIYEGTYNMQLGTIAKVVAQEYK